MCKYFINVLGEATTTVNKHPSFEYLTETPYYSNEDDFVNSAVASHENPNEILATAHSGKYLANYISK